MGRKTGAVYRFFIQTWFYSVELEVAGGDFLCRFWGLLSHANELNCSTF